MPITPMVFNGNPLLLRKGEGNHFWFLVEITIVFRTPGLGAGGDPLPTPLRAYNRNSITDTIH